MHKGGILCTLKHYRQRKGFSQEELASMVGIRRQAIYDMESGRYLPNTAVAIKLARILGCTVEMLFISEDQENITSVEIPVENVPADSRLAMAKIKDKIVSVPLQGAQAMNFQLASADALLRENLQAELLFPESRLEKNILIFGCDPALSIISTTIARIAPSMQAHTIFASSRQALLALASGKTHIAATHFHSTGQGKANIEAVKSILPEMPSLMLGFSLQEEGLMVPKGNPKKITCVEDLTMCGLKFVNREHGAALRKLLDALMTESCILPADIKGYDCEVNSHCDGAFRVANGMADAALGLRVVADAFGLDFVPLTVTQCDLVIPIELCSHPGVSIMLDVLQSARIKNELNALPGYDASALGNIILRPRKASKSKKTPLVLQES